MINIVVRQSSPRITYVVEVLFKILLNTRVAIYEKKIFDARKNSIENLPHINYSGEPIEGSIYIPNTGFLEKNSHEAVEDISFKEENGLFKLFYMEELKEEVNFDLFSATFYLITEYDKYSMNNFDEHKRYIEDELWIIKNNVYKRPEIHYYAYFLRRLLNEKFNLGLVEEHKFDFRITIDIDMPWAYKFRGWKTYGGLLKDLFLFRFRKVTERWKAILGDDPFDTYDFIFSLCQPDFTTFFFLIDGITRYDKFYSYENKHYRNLIKDIQNRGYRIGLHPSYISFKNASIIRYEKRQLEDIVDKKVIRSRQHYLKYRLPDTYQHLLDAGIKHEYTGGFVRYPGFKYGMARPFPWFDLDENVMTRLTIHPAHIMDITLKEYMKLSPDQAFEICRSVIDEVYHVSGRFLLVWHNSSFASSFGWKGWDKCFTDIINYLKSLSEKD